MDRLATKVKATLTLMAARNNISLMGFGHASASTQICMISVLLNFHVGNFDNVGGNKKRVALDRVGLRPEKCLKNQQKHEKAGSNDLQHANRRRQKTIIMSHPEKPCRPKRLPTLLLFF
jgi:hypothetical protein